MLPPSQRDAFFESALLDIVVSTDNVQEVKSLQDAKLFLTQGLKTQVEINMAGRANGAIDRLTRKLWVYLDSKSVELHKDLDKVLKSLQRTLKTTQPLVEQFYEKGVSRLVLIIPEIDMQDENSVNSLALLIEFVCQMHNTLLERVSLVRDKELGTGKFNIPQSLRLAIRNLLAAAKHPQGLYPGQVYNFTSGFKGSDADMIAAMRLLNLKQEFLRKRKFSDNSKHPTSFQNLSDMFNSSLGIKTNQENAFVHRFLKAAINSSVKLHNKGFPGGLIHAVRSRNNVKSDFALCNILGWVEKVPSNHKMLEVLFNTVDTSKDTGNKKDIVVNLTADKRQFTHQEFRTAVALTLPRIDSSRPSDEDMKRDPFSVRSLQICNNFVSDKRDNLVDRLNESYGLKVSLKNPKSKTREIHYKISRDRLLASSANIPLRDSKGKYFSNFSSLPLATQKFLREKFRYPQKRSAPEEESNEQETSSSMQVESSQQANRLLKRTRTMTKGQAKDSIRKSGRLAALRKEK